MCLGSAVVKNTIFKFLKRGESLGPSTHCSKYLKVEIC